MKNSNQELIGGSLMFFLLLISCYLRGQSLPSGQDLKYNPVITAVPFLTISPDSRHSAMGDVGVATSPDANSQYLNPSKYAFVEDKFGISVSYVPWLRKLSNDINLEYIAGFYRLNENQVIASSLRYFSYGDILLTDPNGSTMSNIKPTEYALDFSYSRKLSEEFSGGVAIRYIRTNLFSGYNQQNYSSGNAMSSDVSFYYHHDWQSEVLKTFAAGINISNIGSKISYNEGQNKEFLPANMRLGASYFNQFKENQSLSFSLDFNKLLVPTPGLSGTGQSISASSKTAIDALFSSFSDAPGGLKEELQEVTISTGLEYWYNRRFAVRSGYFNEARNKGNRHFFSTGAGIKMNSFSIDFSYLIPTDQNSPLANVMRFTILFNTSSFKKRSSQEPHPDSGVSNRNL